MIEVDYSKIPKETLDKIPEYVARFRKVQTTTRDQITITEEMARPIIDGVYKCAKYKPPKNIYICDTPIECIELAKKHGATEFNFFFGAMDTPWIAFFMFHREQQNMIKETDEYMPYYEATKLSWYLAYDEAAYLTQHPNAFHVTDDHRLHCADGPAIVWKGKDYEFAHYAWNNLDIGGAFDEKGESYMWIIREPERLETPEGLKAITNCSNAEIKRVMIEKLGMGKYLKLTNAKPIDVNKAFGTLYEIPVAQGREPIKTLHVINHTKNTDGTYDEYFLPVPPNMEKAQQASAWTSGVEEGWENYYPAIET